MEKRPLFPLHTVLFPGGMLPLRIFEQRYLDMIRRGTDQGNGFVVTLIERGKEVGEIPQVYPVGTYSEVADFKTLPDGLLGIVVQGLYRVDLGSVVPSEQIQGLAEAVAIRRPENEGIPLPERYSGLGSLLRTAMTELQDKGVIESGAGIIPTLPDFNSAEQVAWRLAELLPLDAGSRQNILAIDDPIVRLEQIEELIRRIGRDPGLTRPN
ncbi:MAG: LON peptidase substrate-binding domain-containing protein [Magnetococcales bacterium]|nr:LON peptidase substrate-binding domain-containing protein [Magnetococcales bacterium]